MKKLTLKQEKFIDEYIATGNGTQSAIKAGYSPITARAMSVENLAKPFIKIKVEKRRQELAEKRGLVVNDVLKTIEKAIEVGFEIQNLSAVIKGAELQGKYLGMWVEKMDLSVKRHEDWLKEMEDE